MNYLKRIQAQYIMIYADIPLDNLQFDQLHTTLSQLAPIILEDMNNIKQSDGKTSLSYRIGK